MPGETAAPPQPGDITPKLPNLVPMDVEHGPAKPLSAQEYEEALEEENHMHNGDDPIPAYEGFSHTDPELAKVLIAEKRRFGQLAEEYQGGALPENVTQEDIDRLKVAGDQAEQVADKLDAQVESMLVDPTEDPGGDPVKTTANRYRNVHEIADETTYNRWQEVEQGDLTMDQASEQVKDAEREEKKFVDSNLDHMITQAAREMVDKGKTYIPDKH